MSEIAHIPKENDDCCIIKEYELQKQMISTIELEFGLIWYDITLVL